MNTHLRISAFLASALISSSAFALQFSAGVLKQDTTATGPIVNPRIVYLPPSCAIPGANAGTNSNSLTGSTQAATGRTFYVDPVNGSAAGDGSKAKPWRTLAEVIAAKKVATTALVNGAVVAKNAAAPIKAGDTILLLSGDHGLVNIIDHANTDFITVAAAPGAKPVLRGLKSYGSSKWIFTGLTFENPANYKNDAGTDGVVRPSTFVYMDGRSTTRAKLSNIIFVGNTVQSAPTAQAVAWGPKEWAEIPSNGIQIVAGDCVTVSHNTVRNVRFGIGVGGNHINLDHNLIDYWSDDAVRMVQPTYLNIRNNLITNHYGRMNTDNHNDAIQGFPLDPTDYTTVMHDILIDSNAVIESTGAYPQTLDNIPGNGKQNYIQGISEFDGNWKDVTLNNNLIVGSTYHLSAWGGVDGLTITNNTGVGVTSDPAKKLRIGVYNAKNGTAPQRVTVSNNVAPVFVIPKGVANTGNLKTYGIQQNTFVKFDPANADYDFTLKDPALKNVGAKLPNMKF